MQLTVNLSQVNDKVKYPDYLTLLNTDESQSSKSSLDLPSRKESNSVIELKNMQKLYKNIEMAPINYELEE